MYYDASCAPAKRFIQAEDINIQLIQTLTELGHDKSLRHIKKSTKKKSNLKSFNIAEQLLAPRRHRRGEARRCDDALHTGETLTPLTRSCKVAGDKKLDKKWGRQRKKK